MNMCSSGVITCRQFDFYGYITLTKSSTAKGYPVSCSVLGDESFLSFSRGPCFLYLQSPIEGECETFLQYVCSNDVCVSVDHTVDTLMLNKRGGIELKCTVIKTTPYRYDLCVVCT